MTRERPETTCTGCGRKLGVVKYSIESIPGGVYCITCYGRIKKQIDEKDGK
jgi:hypothetical protein